MACGTRYGYRELQQLIRQVGFPENKVVLMSAIFMAESSGCTTIIGTIAKGREYSVGLAQINTLAHKTYTVQQLYNPVTNLTEALRIYNLQGLRAWGAYTDGRYKKYLPDAEKTYNQSVYGLQPPTQTNTIPNANELYCIPIGYGEGVDTSGNFCIPTDNLVYTENKPEDNTVYYILGALLLAGIIL